VYEGSPIVSSSNGILYVYLKPLQQGSSGYYFNGTLMAISDGRKMWEMPLTSHNISYPAWWSGNSYDQPHLSDTMVYARGDKVYVFHDYNETVIGENGTILWSIGDVSAPAPVDEHGFMYIMRTPSPQAGSLRYPFSDYVPDHRAPSNVIEAYYPNGTLYWEYHTKRPLAVQNDPRSVEYTSATLPLYYNGMIYAPMYDSITALYANGTTRWTKAYEWDDFTFDWPFDANNLTDSQKSEIDAYERMYASYNFLPGMSQNGITIRLSLYNPMPFDPAGNVYLQCTSDIPSHGGFSGIQRMYLLAIGPDGQEISRTYMYAQLYVAARDGMGYATGDTLSRNESPEYVNTGHLAKGVADLMQETLVAIDMASGQELWNYTFSVSSPAVVTLDKNNVGALIGGYEAEEAISNLDKNESEIPRTSFGPMATRGSLRVFPCNNTTYVSYQSMNYETPIIPGKSKCAYGGGIYAFDKNGTLLWHKSMLPFYPMRVTQNGTVFYQTPDGKIGVTNTGIAAGFTLTALLYLFLRFLCVGAVARAKARLSKNDNRNCVLEFIIKNPGSSLYEIARGTGINLGTVRYHLFILGINRKITASQTDGKFVRYFTNSGTYSKDEQLILSLMRREAIGRTLGLMLEKPGISNVEIAKELDIKESVVSRHIKELAERSIIEKGADGYAVKDEHRQAVADMVRHFFS
jgi:DNA-binding CsgD family transcriptional regulator